MEDQKGQETRITTYGPQRFGEKQRLDKIDILKKLVDALSPGKENYAETLCLILYHAGDLYDEVSRVPRY